MNPILTWDERKRLSNIEKHGFDFADLTEAFFRDAVTAPTKEARTIAIGRLEGDVIIAVVFRPLGQEALSVISMRRASRAERKALNDNT